MSAFRINITGWTFQFIGTICLWLDSVRVGIRLPRKGIMLGDPPEFDRWYYHRASPIGFFLLMFGFGLCGVALWMFHIEQKRKTVWTHHLSYLVGVT